MFSSFRVPETPSKIGYSLSSVLLSQLDNKEANSISTLDSSSLVSWAFQKIGMPVPQEIDTLAEVGEEVDREHLLEGDLLFFKLNSEEVDHVGVYVGHNKFVHVPKAGEAIVEESVDSYTIEMARRITYSEIVKYVLQKMEIKEVHQSSFITYVDPKGHNSFSITNVFLL